MPVHLVFAGSSFSTASSTQYNAKVQTWVNSQAQYGINSYITLAIGGHNSWSNLVRLSSSLNANTQTVLIDHVQDGDTTITKCSLEAMIRRIWTYNPDIRIIGISSPSWQTQDISNDALVSTPTNISTINRVKADFEYYGTSYADYLAEMIDLVPETYHLNELVSGDTVHPSETGYGVMASLVEAFLPSSGAQLSGSLPDYLYEYTPDFEETPTITLGTDYDSKTGTWAEVGTTIESSTAGSTVVFSGTFRSFGKYRASGADGSVEVDIDGGGFNVLAISQNGYDIGTRAAHTITVRIPAGGSCKIDEFWTI
jgi:lysophospholipase L1-like esterase